MIVGFLVFYQGKDAAVKRKWWPWYCVLMGMLIAINVVSTILHTPSPTPGYNQHLEIPATAFLVFMIGFVFFYIKKTKFCDKCGAMVRSREFTTIKFCPKCGAELPA